MRGNDLSSRAAQNAACAAIERGLEGVVMPHTIHVGGRSLLVTLTAWVFIVLGALASASALVQISVVAALLKEKHVSGDTHHLSLLTAWLMGYMPWGAGAG